ncbi:MAG: hypothetical protein HND48_03790 [Chloroflexi bacterium]|nr:hypothetical protein [Chloroflexota bacterium]
MKSLRPAIWLRLIAMPLALGLVALAATAANYDAPVWGYILIVALTLGFNGLADLGRAVFQGLQRMQYDTLTRLFDKGIGWPRRRAADRRRAGARRDSAGAVGGFCGGHDRKLGVGV